MSKWVPLSRKNMANEQPNAVWVTLSLVGQLGFQIALPLVVFTILGKKLDNWLGTLPLFLLLGIGLSMFVSGYQIYKTIKKIGEK
jgi:hypothetical protein